MKFFTRKWYKYLFEFLSIFVAVISAFALNNWNDNRRDRLAEEKVLREIRSGLKLDLFDVKQNKEGHELGIKLCRAFRNMLASKSFSKDTLLSGYPLMLSDASSISNKTGYESLKAKGLEIVENDTIRYRIVELYDYYYQIMLKNEETSEPLQLFKNYYHSINEIMKSYLVYNKDGYLIDFKDISDMNIEDRNSLYGYLNLIEYSRMYKIHYYNKIEEKINNLIKTINRDQGWTEINKSQP